MPTPLSRVPAQTLLSNLKTQVGAAFAQTAQVLRLLAELDRRDAWADRPYGSLLAYCLGELGWSEGEAAKKIQACRAGRRFPLLLERLGEGRLHLCGLVLLAPRLTEDNHIDLIDAACGKAKRDIERQLAARFPRPDAAPVIRKLPARASAAPAAMPQLVTGSDQALTNIARAGTAPSPPESGQREAFTLDAPTSREAPHVGMAPLAADRHKLTVTIGDGTRERIARIQALLSHRGPDRRSLEAVLDGALELLEAKLLKDRFGVGAKRRRAEPPQDVPARDAVTDPTAAPVVVKGGATSSEHETRAFGRDDRRAIVARDGLRCTYIDPETGVRCSETRWLSLDHVVPWARGGRTTANNGRLLCGAHNRQQARLVFGDDFVRTRMAQHER